ncbi:site-specific integrase [Phenylobacterium sp. J367]|uniref:tyrosine-type recombinase/integrase n=1 Tax=Phenylobacterium sp. J367 TaxID=2898435 RepID=UPI0021508005|nr:site-specific integrase [Phenylobacterium sp. J367]MCR5876976.1 site-specific integrase [Phenylobacterium sp. J367]MCR5877044.1 site-specific integrase [Phenylobacterium sp. J367]
MPDYSLTKIGNSPNWYIQWFEDGHSRRASTRTADRGAAEQVLAAFRLVRADKPLSDLTVGQALDWYWDSHAKNTMRPSNAELGIRYLRPYLGALLVSELTLAKQQAFVEARRKDGAGEESIRRDLSVLSAALRRAEKFNRIDRAPPALSLSPAPPRERWLTRAEVAKLFRQMRKRHRGKRHAHVLLFTRLALYTSARTGAILDLTWDRVDFEAGRIDFHKPGRKLTRKRRTVTPMTPQIRRMLMHAHKHRRSDFVVSWAGKGVDRVAKAVIAHAEKAGLEDVSPHVLRHTFATWGARKGVPIWLLGKALGQTVASTTERYAKHQPEDLARVLDAVRRK